jgi:capsular polysaccharide biosynthesis protein
VINSDDPYWTNCLSCQVRLYARTDILVGLHGAGLTNIVYMPPGSLLVELAGQFDGRMQPVCGYHGPLAGTNSNPVFCAYSLQ